MSATAPANPPVIHPLLARAMQAHQANRGVDARAAYEQLLAEQPDHPDGLHLLGLLDIAQGRSQEGYQLISRALALRPDEPMFHNNLANLCQLMGRLDEAEQHYMASIDLDPSRIDVYNNAALLQARRGDLEAATTTLQRVVQMAPEFSDARQNLVGIHLRGGKVHEAISECAQGLITDPRHHGLRRLLGMAYSVSGQLEQAKEVYLAWLRDEPDRVEPRHHLAGLTGENVPDRAPDAYVRATFDGFAGSFDSKLAALGYKAPEFVASVVQRRCAEAGPALRIADAGCGTGLCGPLLAPFARRLVGVDLSAPMLERARERGGYDELEQAELVEFLRARPDAFDLLVSADTLCYFGRLDDFAAAARSSLAAGGLLVFTVEAHDDLPKAPDFRLHPHGRYSHRLGYLHDALAGAGFAQVQAQAVVLRQEAQLPVHGWLVEAVARPGA